MGQDQKETPRESVLPKLPEDVEEQEIKEHDEDKDALEQDIEEHDKDLARHLHRG